MLDVGCTVVVGTDSPAIEIATLNSLQQTHVSAPVPSGDVTVTVDNCVVSEYEDVKPPAVDSCMLLITGQDNTRVSVMNSVFRGPTLRRIAC